MKKVLSFILIFLSLVSSTAFAKTEKKFELPPLKYDYNALEPYIDERTMMIHHDKHHRAYVDNLNKALEKYPKYYNFTLEELIKSLDSLPKEIQEPVKNNAGGDYNHTFFWEIMTPEKDMKPNGELLKAIEKEFSSLDNFKKEFGNAALNRFGSGWAWLVKDSNGNLKIISTANQDTPIALDLKPILALDVWEHAYYLKYQNRRGEYIENWWNVVNWNKAEELYKE